MKKDNSGYCSRCGIFRNHLHRDHKIPKSLGGSSDFENIQYLCANCHEDKTSVDMIQITKMTWQNPNRRIKQSDAIKKSWQVPGAKERRGKSHSERLKNKNILSKISQSNKNTWSNPIKLMEHSKTMKKVWKKRKENV